MKEKSKKGLKVALVIFIVLFIAALGALGYGYMKYSDVNNKYDELDKKYSELNGQYKDANKTIKDQEETINNTSNGNDYESFVKQMKEERIKLANNKNLPADFNEPQENGFISDNSSLLKYNINLTKDGILYVVSNEPNKKIEVAKDVLFYRVVYIGNGGYKSLCYVTEDGFVYTANVESALVDKTKITSTKQKDAKEIVNILPGSNSDAAQPFFVDINGKIYNYSYE